MKIALICDSKFKFNRVFVSDRIAKLSTYGELSPIVSRGEFDTNRTVLQECEVAFSTWGMPHLTVDEIREYLPNLKAVFYAAGTVQGFASEFLSCGVRVFSAAAANAVPVAEYTFSQIVLANKGYFQSAKTYRPFLPLSAARGNGNRGNYDTTVGLVGLGVIGSLVAQRLQSINAKVLAYDPFIGVERAKELGVELVEPEVLFKECDVISNHLANKSELKNFFDYKLFKLMKKNATFINTGRGAQVNEFALYRALLACPRRTAVVDVLKNEVCPILSPLWWCPNAIITPHIAGSTGHEITRMADYMIEELSRYIGNEDCLYEVTIDKLSRMA